MGLLTSIDTFFTVFGGTAAAIWAIIAIRIWGPKASARGGAWYLEALLILMSVSTVLVSFYPDDGTFSGPLPAINRVVGYLAIVCAIIGLFRAAQTPRKGAGGAIAAVAFFYVALVLSAIAGFQPGLPESYLVTPLIVLTYVLHGGYTRDWLLRTVRILLRGLALLSLAATVAIPEIAFNTVEGRTVFGIERLQGVVGHPNTLGIIAVLGLVLEIHSRSSLIWKLLSLSTLLLAQSFTAYVALIVAAAVMAATIWVRRTIILAGLVAAVTWVVRPDTLLALWAAVAPAEVATLNGRTRIWDAALHGFEQYPIFGFGPTLLNEQFRVLYLPGQFAAAGQAHNQFAQTVSGEGMVGLIALGIMLIVFLVRALRLAGIDRGLGLALLGVLFVRALTETPLRPSGVGISAFMLVLAFGVLVSGKRSDRDPARRLNRGGRIPIGR